MKKNYKVHVTETIEQTFYVKAENQEEAEEFIKDKHYKNRVIINGKDHYIEFETEEIDPTSTHYLIYKGWAPLRAYYISEMFSKLRELNITDYDDYVYDIANCSETQELVGIYDEKYFNSYIADIAGYEFSDLKPGEFEKEQQFYKTEDDSYIIEFQI